MARSAVAPGSLLAPPRSHSLALLVLSGVAPVGRDAVLRPAGLPDALIPHWTVNEVVPEMNDDRLSSPWPLKRRRGMNPDQLRLAARLRAEGHSFVEIAGEFKARYRMPPLVAFRLAHGWSQRDAAEEWNRRWPQDLKTFKNFSYWENWKSPTGYTPDLKTLDKMAQIYQCRVSDLLEDAGDYRTDRPAPTPLPVDRRPSRELVAAAFARADRLVREVTARWPHADTFLAHLRRESHGSWPAWCLLPTMAAGLVTGWPTGRPDPGLTAAVAALFTWRYARSLYVYHPDLSAGLTRTRKWSAGAVSAPAGLLGEWCVYVAGEDPDLPGGGVWAFLDAEHGTGRPVLWLLADLGDDGLDALVPLQVRIDGKPVLIPPENPDGRWHYVASTVDSLLALVTYPARPGADVVAVGEKPDVRPRRALRRIEGSRVWAVGYVGGRASD